jgi:hypothetical protein
MMTEKRSGRSSGLWATAAMEERAHKRQMALWLALVLGVAGGVAGAVYLLRHNDAAHRMDRLLRRCEGRIHNIESSLAELESSLALPQS